MNMGLQNETGVFPWPVHRETLQNGLKIIVIPMPGDGLASYWSVVRTGSRDEVEKGVSGFAHFFEHMMFRGSDKYPGKIYDQIVSSMGADSNASTWDDKTVYHLSIAKDDLPTVVEIEADRFQNLNYDEAAFRTEAGAVYGEYRKGRTNPFEVLYESLQNTAFDVHTYKHTTIGFEADIADMPNQYNYSKTFFKRFYRPENVVICVAGDVDPKSTIELVKSKYQNWKPGYVPPEIRPEPAQTQQRRVDAAFDGQTLPMLAIGFKGAAFQPADRVMLAGRLLDELCFGETSPVYKKLVLDEQKVEQILTDFEFRRDPGLNTVFAIVKDPADIARVEQDLFDAIADIQKNGVGAKRLNEVRSRQKYAFLSSLTTPSDINERIAPYVALTGDMDSIETMFKTRDEITVDDVRNAANLYFTKARSTVAVLQTKGSAAATPAPAELAAPPVLMPVKGDPNITVKLWFRVGSQNDPKGREGLAALTGALLSEGGTRALRYDQILEMLFPLAGGYGVSVDKEMTVASGRVHRDNIQAFYPLFRDAITEPGFREEDFERLRAAAISGIEKTLRYSSDEELGKAGLASRVFEGTRHATITTGTIAGLKAITLQDVRDFYKTYYTKDNVVLALGGSFDDELKNTIARDLARLPSGAPEPVAVPVLRPFTGRHVTLIEKPGPSTAISFGHPIALLRGSREYYALNIARSWLGEHRNSFSHLYQVIREARGLNYGNYAYIEAFPRGGSLSMPPTGASRRLQMFEIWIRPLPREHSVFALRAALRELDHLVRNGMTKEEFEKAKAFLQKYALHYAESTTDRLGYAIDDRFYGIESHLTQVRKVTSEITLEEVNAAIRKYLSTENLQIVMVTEGAAELSSQLASGAPTPIAYKDPKPAAIIEEDAKIAVFPLNIPAANIKIIPVDSMFEK